MKKLLKITLVVLLLALSVGCSNKTASNADGYYRTIIVASFTGDVTVKHKDDANALAAYEGMALLNGDEVAVGEESNLTLDVDSDKHLFVEANTHFHLVAEGDEDSNRTKIQLESGSVLCQIKEKLKDDESFDIETVSSTMSVRGTVFRVSLLPSTSTTFYEMVEVYNGNVWSNISDKNDEVVLAAGQCALIQEEENGSNASYVTDDQIDSEFWASSDTDIKVINETGTGSAVLSIPYNKLSSETVANLITISDSGQELALSSEQLTDLSEIVKYEEEKKAEVEANAKTTNTPTPGVTNENEFRSGALNDDICAEYGHTIITVNGVRQCAICGRQFNDEYHETEKDKANAKAAEESGLPMDITLPDPIHIEVDVNVPADEGSNTGGNDEQPSSEAKE